MKYVDVLAKYLIALTVIVGCFFLIATSVPIVQSGGAVIPPDNTQPWSAITLIVGWLIRDSAGNSAASNAATIAAAQPTIRAGGDPTEMVVTPSTDPAAR